ncbi:MAG: STAS domain-containing protein [Burkholderiales bacterium]|nr:STAS domain-containing protein [Burkholderiales bacterium]
MASKEGSTGILAKMARMLRAPAAGQVDAAESVQGRNSEFDKQEAQARIAAKRRDDMVRRREFDYLRKMRARGMGLSGIVRPSVFQNSSSFRTEDVLPEARARTISKIDAIEAHMSQSWGGPERRASSRFTGAIAPAAPKNPHATPPPRLTDVVKPRPPAERPRGAPVQPQDDDLDLDFTSMLSASVPLQNEVVLADAAPTESPGIEAELPAVTCALVAEATDATQAPRSQRPVLLDLENPALQEAAIRFAEGAYSAAADILRSATQDPQADPSLVDNCMCALLDVYRASDAPELFDEVAIAYAQRFGRSAPEWYSVPDMLSAVATRFTDAIEPAAPAAIVWFCPATLDEAAVSRLANWQVASPERHVNWEPLTSIARGCVPALTTVFTRWAAQPLALTFSRADVLNAVLMAATPEADRTVDPVWWHLRLEALRIQGDQEAYEKVALDYCLIYEVSPPSWLESNSTYSVDEDLSSILPAQTGPDTDAQGLNDAREPEALELRGFLLHGAAGVLEHLRAQVPPGLSMVIECARLVRVDFSAGGSILNWLVERRDDGLQVRFLHVPRLVAALFHVMGITEHAEVFVAKQ